MRQMATGSHYKGTEILLATMHRKEEVIAPPFSELLGAQVEVSLIDTDQFGTFSGEVERKDRSDRVARKKCLTALDRSSLSCGLSSEGSFGPHPELPFSVCDHEILYFIDHKRNFELIEQLLTPQTNFSKQSISSFSELEAFAEKTLFPSHALILKKGAKMVKGIQNCDDLERAFYELCLLDGSNYIEAETDMRTHHNPTRMKIIGQLAYRLAKRLSTACPAWALPGFGMVGQEPGLPCIECGTATERVAFEIHKCAKCPHEEQLPRADGLQYAQPAECSYCNP